MPIRTYAGRLLFVSIVSSLSVLVVSASLAGYLYLDQSRTADLLSEDIGSRGAAINVEATLNNLASLHSRGVVTVEPLHTQLMTDMAEVERFVNKPRERELADELRNEFTEYLRLWQSHVPSMDLADYLRAKPLPSVQALRKFNGDEMRASEEVHRRSVNRMIWGLALVGGLGSIAGLVFGFGLARSLRRAVQQFMIRVQGASDLLGRQVPDLRIEGVGEPLQDGATDLVNRVEQAVRRMNEQEREVWRAERLAAVGRLAAGMAHEVRNPLTSAILLLETAGHDPTARLTQEDVDLITQELHRIESTLQTFLDYARPPKPAWADCDLTRVVQDAVALARGRINQAGITVRLNVPADPCRLLADRTQLVQVVLNLLLNAVDAMPTGGVLTIDLAGHPTEGTVELAVRDTGLGIAHDVLPRLFEPFVTGKETGTGLGLVVSRRMVEDHGGTITGSNDPGGGARFLVRLPVRLPAAEPARSE
jgi:two-component system sensor histidine kinase HydH